MGLFSKSKAASTTFDLNPCGGSVLTLQSKYGTYLTACEDKRTVSLEEKLPGSNNPQCWTVVRFRPWPDSGVDRYYFLKSIYGTFLARRWLSDVCQKYWPADQDSSKIFRDVDDLLWELSSEGPSDSPVDHWFSLNHISSIKLHPKEDGSLEMDSDTDMCWLVGFVDWDKNTIIVKHPHQNTQTRTSTVVPNHPSPLPNIGQYEHSGKSDKPKVVSINFNSVLGSNSGPGGPPSLYNAGHNVNHSGTQKNGDIDIRNQVGPRGNFYFLFP